LFHILTVDYIVLNKCVRGSINMKFFVLGINLFLVTACSTTNVYNVDHLISKNKIYEHEIKLLMRENSVLRKENAGNNETIKENEARIEKITLDLNVLQNKYDSDVKQFKNQYEALRKENSILIAESNEKIKELTEHNKTVEKNLNNEIMLLTSEIKKITESFNNEREQLKKDSARRELKLVTDINELVEQKKSAEKKHSEEIVRVNDELKKLTDNFNNEREQFKKTSSDRETELVKQISTLNENLKTCSNTNLDSAGKIKNLNLKIDELQKQLDSLTSKNKSLQPEK
jgi:chromosome segregation ATPase